MKKGFLLPKAPKRQLDGRRQLGQRQEQHGNENVPLSTVDVSTEQDGASSCPCRVAAGVYGSRGTVVFRLRSGLKQRFQAGEFDSELPLLFFVHDQERNWFADFGATMEVQVCHVACPDTFPWLLPESVEQMKAEFAQHRFCFRWSAAASVPQDWRVGLGRALRTNPRTHLCVEMPEIHQTLLYFKVFHAWCEMTGSSAGVQPMLVNFESFRKYRGDEEVTDLFCNLVKGVPVSTFSFGGPHFPAAI